jgi:hypothetical protein
MVDRGLEHKTVKRRWNREKTTKLPHKGDNYQSVKPEDQYILLMIMELAQKKLEFSTLKNWTCPK